MALSNILVEPRREITETVIGAAAIGGYVALNYTVTRWIKGPDDPLPITMVTVLVSTIALVGLLFLVHFVGEMISNWLGRQGHDPRPAQRYSAKQPEVRDDTLSQILGRAASREYHEWMSR